jgi:transcriptional antiterminator
MKHFLIYQFFIDKHHKEGNYIVSKQIACNNNDAKTQYLTTQYPNSLEKQQFIEKYLTIVEISEIQFNVMNQDEIDYNRKLIGIWL